MEMNNTLLLGGVIKVMAIAKGSLADVQKQLYLNIPYFMEHHDLPEIVITKQLMAYGRSINTLLFDFERILCSEAGFSISQIRDIIKKRVRIEVLQAFGNANLLLPDFKPLVSPSNIVNDRTDYSKFCDTFAESAVNDGYSSITFNPDDKTEFSKLDTIGFIPHGIYYIKKLPKVTAIIDTIATSYKGNVYLMFKGTVPVQTKLYNIEIKSVTELEQLIEEVNNLVTLNESSPNDLFTNELNTRDIGKRLYEIAINHDRAAFHALNGGLTQPMIDKSGILFSTNIDTWDIPLFLELIHSNHINYCIHTKETKQGNYGLEANLRVTGRSLSTYPTQYAKYIPLLVEVEEQCLYTWHDAEKELKKYVGEQLKSPNLASELWSLLESSHKIGNDAKSLEYYANKQGVALGRKNPDVKAFRCWYFNFVPI